MLREFSAGTLPSCAKGTHGKETWDVTDWVHEQIGVTDCVREQIGVTDCVHEQIEVTDCVHKQIMHNEQKHGITLSRFTQ